MKKITFFLIVISLFSLQSYSQCSFDSNDGGTITDGNFSSTSANLTLNNQYGQSFKACQSGTLNSIGIIALSASSSIAITVYDGTGKTGTNLGTVSSLSVTAAASINDRSILDMSSAGISLVSGQTYTFYATSGSIASKLSNASIYADGDAYDNNTASPVNDFLFSIDIVASADTTAPTFENSTPSSSSIGTTTFTLATDIDEAGTIYYVVVADGASAPTAANVKAGTGNGGASALTSGNATVSTGGFTNDFSVTSLTAGTAYDVYVVAEDDEGTPNLQSSATKIDVKTAVSLPHTINFETTHNTNLGSTAIDGEGGSFDITNEQYDFTLIDASGNATNVDIIYEEFGGNYEGLHASPGGTYWRGLSIKSNGGSEFDFNGFSVSENDGTTLIFTVEGFKDGISTGSTTVNHPGFTPTTYTISDFVDGTFGNVDEVKIIANLNFTGNFDNFALGTVVADITAPTLTSSLPTDGATVVSTSSNIVLTFDENIAFGTGNIQVIDLTDGSNSFTIDAASPGAQASISGAVLTINPSSDMDDSSNYAIQIAATAIDDTSGNSYAGITNNTTLNFSTVDETNPTFNGASCTPNDNATNVSVSNNIVLDFSEDIALGTSGYLSIENLDDMFAPTIQFFVATDSDGATTSPSAGKIGVVGNKVYLNPSSNLAEETNYNMNIQATAIDDTSGNSFAGFGGDGTFNFTTGDFTAPTLNTSGSTPTDDATGIAIANDIVVDFSEDIAAGTGNITVRNVTGSSDLEVFAIIGATATSSPTAGNIGILNDKLYINPTNNLKLGNEYAIQIAATAIDDTSGNSFAGITDETTFSFTTSNPTVAFTSTSSSGAESVSSANLEVSLSAVSGSNVSVNYTVTGTATGSGTDYTLANGTLTIIAGDTTDDITIASIVSDAILESNETVIVTISSPTNATLGTNTSHTYTINNDDAAAVTIADISGNENDGAITVTATLDNAVQGGFTVDVSTANGTATTADSDYSSVTSQTLTFTGNANETQTFTVTPTGDTKLEGNETVTISQSNLASTTLAVNITDGATVTINNDDFLATVTTDDASVVTSNTVDLGGDVIAEGSTSVTARGIVYAISSENANPQIGGANVITDDNGTGSGVFSETISSLAANTQYSYVAYSTNTQGTSYGTVKTFTTAVLGVEDISFEDLISLYPNPVNNELHINTNNIKVEAVLLFDVLGKSIKNINLKNNIIDVSNINSGVYLLRVKTEQGTLTKRIIKN